MDNHNHTWFDSFEFECICIFDDHCEGSGVVHCLGCDEDEMRCVCPVCNHTGQEPCGGCCDCDPLPGDGAPPPPVLLAVIAACLGALRKKRQR